MSADSVSSKKRVVVVGGGTGTHTVLRGLKHYTDQLEISAIVSMADSGGSTGRLRDEFGQLPVGDVRNALTALADTDTEHAQLLRELFLYRFNKGDGLSGHNFGNLFITALTDMLGTEEKAIVAAGKLLRVAGEVVPVTTDSVQLVAEFDDGVVITGEAKIDVPDLDRYEHRITALTLTPTANITKRAHTILTTADVVIIGPGDLYTSIIPNALVGGFTEALQENKGIMLYVCNLMSRPGQTHGMHAREHVAEIVRYFKREPDRILLNGTPLPPARLLNYLSEGDHVVDNNCTESDGRVRVCPLVLSGPVGVGESASVSSGLARHDSLLLAKAILTSL